MCREPADLLSFELNGAGVLNLTHNGFDRGGTANSVPAEQADDFPFSDRERNTLNDVTFFVISVQIVYFKHFSMVLIS
jgi:hypothetical protein